MIFVLHNIYEKGTSVLKNTKSYYLKTIKGAKNKAKRLVSQNAGLEDIDMPEWGLYQCRDVSSVKGEVRTSVVIEPDKLSEKIKHNLTQVMILVGTSVAEIEEELKEIKEDSLVEQRIRDIIVKSGEEKRVSSPQTFNQTEGDTIHE